MHECLDSLPFPQVRGTLEESLWIASPRVLCGSTQMYHCLDDYNAANGFSAQSFCSNRQPFQYSINAQRLPPQKVNTSAWQKFRGKSKFASRNSILCSRSSPVPQSVFPGCPNYFFDLTAARIPTIIMRTSLLWRADKPSELGSPGRGLHGWRQNIFLLPAVLFPHLERELQLPLSVVSSKVAVSKSPFRNAIRT
jgi:hypothetical protein